jgi:hypothetical protein
VVPSYHVGMAGNVSAETIRRYIERSEPMEKRRSIVEKPKVKRPNKPSVPNRTRTGSIQVEADAAAFSDLVDTQSAYAAACNLLVPVVVESRCWNRVDLPNKTYETPLGSQICCNVFRTVCGAHLSMRSNGEIEDGDPVPTISFRYASVHSNACTYRSGAEPTTSGRPRPIRGARRKSPFCTRRCNRPRCCKLADVIHVRPWE